MTRLANKHHRICSRQSERAKASRLTTEAAGEWSREPAEVTTIQFGSLTFNVFDEPSGADWPDRVRNLYLESHGCLKNASWQEAERLLRLALQLCPNDPTLRNNLATAREGQGYRDESLALVASIHQEYPDYVFARTALARHAMRNGRIDEANALLQPIRQSNRVHVDELVELCLTEMDLCIMADRTPEAVSWLELLRLIYPDHPFIQSTMATLILASSSMKRFQEDHEKRARRKAAKASELRTTVVTNSTQPVLPFEPE